MIDATPLLRLYAARRRAVLAREDPARAQEATLRRLVRAAARTRFGREHGFSEIGDVAAFQRRVPIRRYEEFWARWWQDPFPTLVDVAWPGKIPFFALSSGTTTGRTKRIPVSRQMVASNRRAALDILVHHLASRPDSRVFAGRSFMLGGSTALERLAPGVEAGDLSGIAAATIPIYARPRAFPPRGLALEANWERKIAALAPASLEADVRAISGTPTWLLAFFETLARVDPRRGERLAGLYPDLELVIHGGVSFAPYARRFDRLLEGSRARTQEVYPASEGFFAIEDRGRGEGMRLRLDDGIFYEFVDPATLDDPAPARGWIADSAEGVDYALVVSTNAGLWAYRVGDLVRLVSRDPPRVVFSGRTDHTLSAFGEHVTGAELDRAATEAARAIDADVADFSVGARHRALGAPRDHHLLIVELAGERIGEERARRLRDAFDAALARGNADYAAHREAGQLGAPAVLVAPRGTFAAWMRARGKLGGQNKAPRVVEGALLESLERAAERGTRVGPDR